MAAATPDPNNQPDIHAQRVLILDFGGQYTQLIARRVREAGVYSEIFPWDVTDQDIREFAPQGIILSGGPESAIDNSAAVATPRAPAAVFDYGVPVLALDDVKEAQVEVGLGPLHTQFDDQGYAYTSLFLDSAVARWSLGGNFAELHPEAPWQLVGKIPVHYNIGHLLTAEGDRYEIFGSSISPFTWIGMETMVPPKIPLITGIFFTIESTRSNMSGFLPEECSPFCFGY